MLFEFLYFNVFEVSRVESTEASLLQMFMFDFFMLNFY